MVPPASAYGWICTMYKVLCTCTPFLIPNTSRDGSGGLTGWGVTLRNRQEKSRVEYCMCICLSWKRTSIDENKRAPLLTPRNMTAFPSPPPSLTIKLADLWACSAPLYIVLYDTEEIRDKNSVAKVKPWLDFRNPPILGNALRYVRCDRMKENKISPILDLRRALHLNLP